MLRGVSFFMLIASPALCSGAIDETERRRTKQIAYNTEHGIVPKTVAKNVGDILDSLYDDEEGSHETQDHLDDVATIGHNFEAIIDDLEQKMMKAAEDLEFEEAARLRDEIKRLKDQELLVANDPLSKRFSGSDLSVPSIDKKRKSRLKKNSLDEMGPSNERPLLKSTSTEQDASNEAEASPKKKKPLSKKARPRSSGGKPGTRTKKGKSHRSGL